MTVGNHYANDKERGSNQEAELTVWNMEDLPDEGVVVIEETTEAEREWGENVASSFCPPASHQCFLFTEAQSVAG